MEWHREFSILMIDDEEDFRFFLKRNLENAGDYEVVTAGSGGEGIEMAVAEKPDIILLDISMPEMSGEDVKQVLSKRPETENIPVIFLTALVTEDDAGGKTMVNLAGHNFISKPVATKDLIGAVNKVLGKS